VPVAITKRTASGRALPLGLMLVVSALLLGCLPPTAENVTQRYAALLGQVADRLDRVQARDDADWAAADIRELLQKSDGIAKAARDADASKKPSDSTQQAARQASSRLAASIERIRTNNLMTPDLSNAVQQIGLSFESVASAMAVGKLPAGDTPLEQAWAEVIATYDEKADLLATIAGHSDAERAIDRIVAIEKKQFAALKKVAEHGGEAPPHGVPDKYRKHFQAAEARMFEMDGAATSRMGAEAAQRLNQQLQQARAAYLQLETDPFRLPAAIRTAATKATVTLVNNKSLGENHRPMIDRLQELAGASHAESVIENDGTYNLVLAPVPNFGRFVQSIDFGDISNRDDSSMSFTLTIDPARFEAVAGVDSGRPGDPRAGFGRPVPGGPGRPPFGPPGGPGPRGGSPAEMMEHRKADFIAKTGGPQRTVTLILQGAPDSRTPEYNALLSKIKAQSGASSTMGLAFNGQRQLVIAPVEDFDALVEKIDFGTVTSKDPAKREITVAVSSP
jgi:hypothetical protein